jgi:hypothetical protein
LADRNEAATPLLFIVALTHSFKNSATYDCASLVWRFQLLRPVDFDFWRSSPKSHWISVIQQLHRLDARIVVPGHGPPGTRKILRRRIADRPVSQVSRELKDILYWKDIR